MRAFAAKSRSDERRLNQASVWALNYARAIGISSSLVVYRAVRRSCFIRLLEPARCWRWHRGLAVALVDPFYGLHELAVVALGCLRAKQQISLHLWGGQVQPHPPGLANQ